MTDLKPIMHEVAQLHKTHGVKQKGNTKYTQVVHRMEAFRKHLGTSVGIDTEIKVDDGKRVVIKATAKDMNGFIIGSGYAEEIRGKGHVNQTSALENAETSAIGRCLASLGLGGGEYASANELDAVARKIEIKKQEEKEKLEKENNKEVIEEKNDMGDASPKVSPYRYQISKSKWKEDDWIEEIDALVDSEEDLRDFYLTNKVYFIKDTALNENIVDYCSHKKSELMDKLAKTDANYEKEVVNG